MLPDQWIALRDILADLNSTGLVRVNICATPDEVLRVAREVLADSALWASMPAVINGVSRQEVYRQLQTFCNG